jgi:hypothetical protein
LPGKRGADDLGANAAGERPHKAGKETDVAEISIERKQQRSILPWVLGLALVALLIWGLAEAFDRDAEGETEGGAAEVGTVKDKTEPRFRQYAGLAETAPWQAAA